jgi:NAD kinase
MEISSPEDIIRADSRDPRRSKIERSEIIYFTWIFQQERIAGFAFAFDETTTYCHWVENEHRHYQEFIKLIFGEPRTVVMHDCKNTYKYLRSFRVEPKCTFWDVQIAHYLLQPERKHQLNDLALSRGAHGDVISFDVSVSGNHIDNLRGDGFVVSTATGSTGYALSAGGPIVTPEFGGMVCVPVAPHTIMARAFLTSPSDVVEIRMDSERPVETCVFADGRPLGRGLKLCSASCRRGLGDIILLDYSAQSFYGSVSRVFYGKAADR